MKKELVLLGITVGLIGGVAISNVPTVAQAKTTPKKVTTLPAKDYGNWYAYLGTTKKQGKKVYVVGKINLNKTSKQRTHFGVTVYYSSVKKLTNLNLVGSATMPAKVIRYHTKKHKRVAYKLRLAEMGAINVKRTHVKVSGKSKSALRLTSDGEHLEAFKQVQRTHSWDLTDILNDF